AIEAASRGISGKAPRFDGSAYFVVGDDGMLQFPKITVSAWIKPDLVQGRWGVVAKRSRSAPAPYVVAIRDGRVTFEGTDAAGNWSYNFSSGPVLKPNVWSHIAAVCEEGAGVRLYSNGELVAEKRVTEPLAETTDVLTIGYENWGGIPAKAGQSGNFHGFIDEVKIWSRLLSPDEIAAEYAALKPAAEADARRMAQEAAARSALARKYESNLVADGGVKWRLVEFDDFERDTIGSDWKTLRGRWVINNGRVSCSETAFLGYARKVGFPVRIEFDGRSDRPGDLTAFWGTEAQAYKGGYFIGFASNNNTANKILRLGEQVAINDGPVATPGRWHHVIAQAFDGKVQLIVDGRLVLEYADPDPLTTAYMPGIIAWSEGEFDNVRIYTGR
ncbi:MAG: LamG domain-containing protein, partial [Armatimonadota bacterium]